jgi:ubiquinone/menaquinone biosynthesis C-methylase UbiE
MPAESFDVAVSCFGFQIVTQPEIAVQEILRVMKPGGRAGFTVWSTGDKASAIDVLIGPMLEHATPDGNGYLPTPYELGGPGELVEMLQKVGFEKTREVRTSGVWSARTTNEYLAMILEGTPLGHSLGEEDPDVQEMILKKAQENIKQYETPHGVSIPTECVVVLASKPAITH